MKHLVFLFVISILGINCKSELNKTVSTKNGYTIVLHGGAGTITRKDLTPEKEAAFLAALDHALSVGENVLKTGGSALNAVEATIKILEDSPLFNAGKGSVFTNEGKNEMDAAIMDGATQKAGAIGGVTNVKNPITGAIAVMNNSPHVMLVGKGAELFCANNGCTLVEPAYFFTEHRWQSLQKALREDSTGVVMPKTMEEKKRGTVGCVALDTNGNIAAGTSTGGMTNKKYGRIGDAPIIGAGTFADNNTCGVSCTGHGEYFIRYTVARDVAAMMEYGGKTLAEATTYLVHKKLVEKGGEGGLIAIDKSGNIAMPFNTEGMYRASSKNGTRSIKIYKDQ